MQLQYPVNGRKALRGEDLIGAREVVAAKKCTAGKRGWMRGFEHEVAAAVDKGGLAPGKITPEEEHDPASACVYGGYDRIGELLPAYLRMRCSLARANRKDGVQKQDPVLSFVDQLCNMYGQTKDQAIDIAKGLGFTLSEEVDDGRFFCYRNDAERAEQVGITLILEGGRVNGISYTDRFTGTTPGAKGKEFAEQIGETRTFGSYSCKFCEGSVSAQSFDTYSAYLQQVGNAQDDTQANWNTGKAEDEGYGISVFAENDEGSVFAVIDVGFLEEN